MKIITLPDGTRLNADAVVEFHPLPPSFTELSTIDGKTRKLEITPEELEGLLPKRDTSDVLEDIRTSLEKSDPAGTVAGSIRRLCDSLARLTVQIPHTIKMHL